jgi:hypothetical protein
MGLLPGNGGQDNNELMEKIANLNGDFKISGCKSRLEYKAVAL